MLDQLVHRHACTLVYLIWALAYTVCICLKAAVAYYLFNNLTVENSVTSLVSNTSRQPMYESYLILATPKSPTHTLLVLALQDLRAVMDTFSLS